ncbi:PREDICTED: pre-mRNA-splicing factor SYF2-like [Amphimedon queenslandica]|uniref:Pre-mRNA-splicing factor SYF2 n=2 Tax=Amphimedon queenslandica TaxID=400682 RepID=A0AAN0JC53_AMPQE|nr:PREDICTED: pre-mRNA-splicing factor SYF2-like [Amphimedon queenslandica]XP_019854321.1 PREDICTED: pre-mRNA-splicing factor SYF2-like [Amphimedon queenslandica]|eukprot:XP_019854319.1 PREDICTED: pre-mRNA-splicing factor SYF2-like [Amphimedon queenslandica]
MASCSLVLDGREIKPGSEGIEEQEEEVEEEEQSREVQDNAETVLSGKSEERLKRFRELHLRRNEAKKLNRKEVVEEDRRNKLPANFEIRRRKAEWEEQEEEFKKKAEEAGEDYKQLKLLDASADELDRLQRKRKKKNPDPGFSDYKDAQYRQYERLIKQVNPDLESYEKKKLELESRRPWYLIA